MPNRNPYNVGAQMNARGYLDWDNFRFAPAVPGEDKVVRTSSLGTGETVLRPQNGPRLFETHGITTFAATRSPEKQH